jgi:uncharacterized protein YegP (UPF0339 family)
MLKLVRGLALVAAMSTVSVAALSVAEAQEKGKKATGKTTGIVEVNEGKDGKFRLVIRDNDEKFLASSAAFATKEEATKGIEKLKDALENPKITSKKSANGKGKDKE